MPIRLKKKSARVLALTASMMAGVSLLWGYPNSAGAAVRRVPDGEYSTIQQAIDASDAGDVVIVEPGIYEGDVDFSGKSITVRSSDPNDPNVIAATVIDAQGSAGQLHCGVIFQSGEDANTVLDGLTITGGYANYGGGIFCWASGPKISNCVIKSNAATHNGGGIFCQLGSNPIIRNCRIIENAAGSIGGGISCEGGSSVNLESSVVSGNIADYFGGGFYCDDSEVNAVNSIISGNWAGSYGGGGYGAYSNLALLNCDVLGNRAQLYGGGMRGYLDTNINMINCVIWGNELMEAEGVGPQISLVDETAEPQILYSDIEEGVVHFDPHTAASVLAAGNRNIAAEPRFVGEGYWDDDVWVEGDYRLREDSPCRNIGDDSEVVGLASDIAGSERIIGSGVDMGAYEMAVPDGPDLVGQFGQVILPQPLVPGDKVQVEVVTVNAGNIPAVGRMDINLYLSTNNYLDAADPLIGQLVNKPVNLDPNEARMYKVKGVVPASAAAGNYFLLAQIDADEMVAESDASYKSNVVVGDEYEMAWRFGEFATRKNVKLTVLDSKAVEVTFSLRGGWGEIDGGPELAIVYLHDTDEKSALVISTKGAGSATSVGDIMVLNGSLNCITAKTTDLWGNILVNGILLKLTLRDVTGAGSQGHVIAIYGQPSDGKSSLTMSVNRVADLSVESPFLPIKSIKAAEWLNSDGQSDVIAAPWLGILLVKGDKRVEPALEGDFQADMSLSGDNSPSGRALAGATISGAIDGAFWDIAGSVGNIKAGKLNHSALWLGCAADLTELAGQEEDFAGNKFSLGSLRISGVNGECFHESEIAAWNIGSLTFAKEASGDGYIQYSELGRGSNVPEGIELHPVSEP